MNWEILAAIAELASAIAVLVTLIYLARQTKEAARSTKLDLKYRRFDEFRHFGEYMSQNPEYALKLQQCSDPNIELNLEDQSTWGWHVISRFDSWNATFDLWREGILSDDEFEFFGRQDMVNRMKSYPRTSRTWKLLRDGYPTNFKNYVDSEIEKIESGT